MTEDPYLVLKGLGRKDYTWILSLGVLSRRWSITLTSSCLTPCYKRVQTRLKPSRLNGLKSPQHGFSLPPAQRNEEMVRWIAKGQVEGRKRIIQRSIRVNNYNFYGKVYLMSKCVGLIPKVKGQNSVDRITWYSSKIWYNTVVNLSNTKRTPTLILSHKP